MNKKGSTLIELIISIALISVILVFMVKLLVDINNTESNNDYAKNNQIIRAEIIKAIETDIGKKNLTNVTDTKGTNKLVINFYYSDSTTAKIEIENKSLTFTPSSGDIRKWTLKEGEFYLDKFDKAFETDSSGNYQFLYLNIEVHTQNDNNTIFRVETNTKDGREIKTIKTKNNILDDISISYIKKK